MLYKRSEQEPSFERQFGTMANAMVDEKLPMLSKYMLGFQVIDKNQQDTEGVGAGIYNIDGMYVYMPSFFRKGRIKAGEMMFLPERKQFLPATEQWISELREQQGKIAGDLVKRPKMVGRDGSARNTRSGERQDPFSKTATIEMLKYAETDTENDLLDNVIALGKNATATMLDTLTENTRFCNAVIRWYGPEKLNTFLNKAASLEELPKEEGLPFEVITPYTKEAAALEGRELKAMYRDGFYIRTNKTKFAEVMRDESSPETFSTPQGMGEYDVLLPDGSMETMLLLGAWNRSIYGVKNGAVVTVDPKTACVKKLLSKEELDKKIEGIGRQITEKDVYGTPEKEEQFGVCEGPLEKVIIDPTHKCFIECDLVHGYGADNGTGNADTEFRAPRRTHSCRTSVMREGATLSVLDHSIVVPANARILEAYPRTEIPTAKVHDVPYMTNKIKQAGYNMSVRTDGPSYIIKGDMGNLNSNLLGAVEHLVTKYDINPGEAKAICKEACSKQVKVFVKKADAQADIIIASNQATIPFSELNNQTPTLTDIKPQEKEYGMEETGAIVNNAVNAGVKEVFDVSVLNLLASTNRPFEEVAEYVKINMKTLDSLCRLQFLLYWKMAEFEERYGASKMAELEETLINSIDTISDLTLFLRTRSVLTTTINERTDGNIMDEGM